MARYDQPLQINLPRLQYSIEYMGDYSWYVGTVFNYENIYCATNFVFTDWNGNKHPFENVGGCNSVHANTFHKNITDSSDGSFYQLDTSTPTDLKVYANDGTVYHFTTGNPPLCSTTPNCPSNNIEDYYDVPATSIIDPNGNQITIQGAGSNSTVLTDTLGRMVTITPGGVSYYDSNGTAQQITVTTTPSPQKTTFNFPLSCYY
jgi:hypothetical protein